MRALVAFLGLALPLLAQQHPRLRVEGPTPAVVKLGDTAHVDITWNGEGQAGGVTLPKVDGLQMEVSGPSTDDRLYMVGGAARRSVQVSWTVYVKPTREGKFQIPPISVAIGGQQQRTELLPIEAVKDVKGGEYGFLKVTLPKKRVYVHEPLRVVFQFGFDASLKPIQRQVGATPYLDVALTAAWLDEPDGAVLIEKKRKPEPGVEVIPVVGNNQVIEAVIEKGHERNGRPFFCFVVERSYLPSRIGKQRFSAPMLRFQVQDERNLRRRFESFFPEVNGKNYYVYGEDIDVEVLPIPEAGRPQPYYGAVGRFSVAARCEQTRVKLGAPLRLVLRVQGDGNLEFLNVPPLDNLPGLHLLGKKEQRTKDAVEVTYDLRVVDLATKEVPAIRYDWFDTTPGVEKFVGSSTPPIPIEVLPAAPGEGLKVLPGEEAKPVKPGVDDIYDVKPLDAAASVPLAPAPSRALAAFVLSLPWVVALLGAFAAGKIAKHRADLRGHRARAAKRRCMKALESGDAALALAGYLADRIDSPDAAVVAPDLRDRLVAHGMAAELAGRVVAALDSGLAARYGGGGGLTREQVGALVAELERWEVTRPPAALAQVLALLLAALVLATSASAQGEADRGILAYRKGEYGSAADAFAKAAAEPGADRRLCYDLGNAQYRQGKLGEALLAYERARLAFPRDPELLANVALVRRQLELGSAESESFAATVARLRESLTPRERFELALALGTLAALVLAFGHRRALWRWLGVIVAVPYVLLALEVLWLAPARPARGIVLAAKSALVAEPQKKLVPIAELKTGVEVLILERSAEWTRVRIGERSGYLPASEVGIVE